MPGLEATGELSYNGYTFDGASHVTAKVEFLKDPATHRVTIVHAHTFTVRAVVAGSDGINPNLDQQLEEIRTKLGQTGGRLVFRQKGFGNDIDVGPGGYQDVTGGPHPQVLMWEPIGDNKAAEIVWTVTAHVAVQGTTGLARFSQVLAINYDVTFDHNEFCDTTRTFTGTIELSLRARTRVTADAFRDWFTPERLSGFHRKQSWTTSADRRTLSFTVTDTEIQTPNPYPPNMVEIQGSHSVKWSASKHASFINTISMTIAPGALVRPARAYQTFVTLAGARLLHARQRDGNPFILSLDITENIFGRPQQFSITYRLTHSIDRYIGTAGLWRNIGTTWSRWNPCGTNRGNAGLKDQAIGVDDNVVKPIITKAEQQRRSIADILGPDLLPTIKNVKPKDPANSMLEFRNQVITTKNDHKTSHVTVQNRVDTQEEGRRNRTWDINNSPTVNPFSYTQQNTPEVKDIIQSGAKASYYARVAGYAKRAGYAIARPVVDSIGDAKAYLLESRGGQQLMGNVLGVDVFEAWWIVDYLLDGPPGNVEPPPDWVAPEGNSIISETYRDIGNL